MRARYIHEVGTRAHFRIYWDEYTISHYVPDPDYGELEPEYKDRNSCRNSFGYGKPGYHQAMTLLGTSPKLDDWEGFPKLEKMLEDPRWPTKCDYCEATVPENNPPRSVGDIGTRVTRQIFKKRFYDTASGNPEPGDIYELQYHLGHECPHWDNCDGIHTMVVLPTGEEWDVDSRANNCTLRDDRTHRCWVKTGIAKLGTLDVGKNGRTCSAGAGSIATPKWHGFLRNFELVV